MFRELKSRNLKVVDAAFEIKSTSDEGAFIGIASPYGNVDDGGDVVEAGAFKEFELTADRKIRILQQHDDDLILGKGSVEDTPEGLKLSGQLNLKVARVRDHFEFVKDGTINALSIGYSILPGGATYDGDVRRLQKLKLWEVSLVTFPMNTLARVDAVKSLTTIRDCEDFLRDAGMSRAAAKAFAVGGYKKLVNLRDAGVEVSAELLQLRDFLKERRGEAQT